MFGIEFVYVQYPERVYQLKTLIIICVVFTVLYVFRSHNKLTRVYMKIISYHRRGLHAHPVYKKSKPTNMFFVSLCLYIQQKDTTHGQQNYKGTGIRINFIEET